MEEIYVKMISGRVHAAVAFSEEGKLGAKVEINGHNVSPTYLSTDTFGYLRLRGIDRVSDQVKETLSSNLTPLNEGYDYDRFTHIRSLFREVNWYK